MKLRTVIEPLPLAERISYLTPVLLVGSCFASEVGAMFDEGKMNVMINPFGVLYNPVSVSSELEIIAERREFTIDDLHLYNNRYLSFYHDTGFSSTDPEVILRKINSTTNRAHQFLAEAEYLFVTFGTARVFRRLTDRSVVANCHKMPSSEFERELLTVEYIVELWTKLVGKLHRLNPNLRIFFTVSPVRHWKDGAHGNQVSKAIRMLAIDKLVKNNSILGYFPSYELLLDDLRDYRFYKDDLLHPSRKAIEYIWEFLTKTFFDPDTISLFREVSKVKSAMHHKLMGDIESDHRLFAESMLARIN
ncbi:MAG: GSCFA domain protein, partial [Bacteroidia bacterium]